MIINLAHSPEPDAGSEWKQIYNLQIDSEIDKGGNQFSRSLPNFQW